MKAAPSSRGAAHPVAPAVGARPREVLAPGGRTSTSTRLPKLCSVSLTRRCAALTALPTSEVAVVLRAEERRESGAGGADAACTAGAGEDKIARASEGNGGGGTGDCNGGILGAGRIVGLESFSAVPSAATTGGLWLETGPTEPPVPLPAPVLPFAKPALPDCELLELGPAKDVSFPSVLLPARLPESVPLPTTSSAARSDTLAASGPTELLQRAPPAHRLM